MYSTQLAILACPRIHVLSSIDIAHAITVAARIRNHRLKSSIRERTETQASMEPCTANRLGPAISICRAFLHHNSKDLAIFCPSTLNYDDRNNDTANRGYHPNDCDVIHFIPPFFQRLKNCLNESDIIITAGPSVTTNKEGKMKKTSGNTSFTLVFAACSSTFWRR